MPVFALLEQPMCDRPGDRAKQCEGWLQILSGADDHNQSLSSSATDPPRSWSRRIPRLLRRVMCSRHSQTSGDPSTTASLRSTSARDDNKAATPTRSTSARDDSKAATPTRSTSARDDSLGRWAEAHPTVSNSWLGRRRIQTTRGRGRDPRLRHAEPTPSPVRVGSRVFRRFRSPR